jgi:hypothetical protein
VQKGSVQIFSVVEPLKSMSTSERSSYEGSDDLTSVIAEFPNGDDMPGQAIPVKKLSEQFDNCVKGEGHMKVYLRIKPNSHTESTITVESGKFSGNRSS